MNYTILKYKMVQFLNPPAFSTSLEMTAPRSFRAKSRIVIGMIKLKNESIQKFICLPEMFYHHF